MCEIFAYGAVNPDGLSGVRLLTQDNIHTIESHSASRMPFAIVAGLRKNKNAEARVAGRANDSQSTEAGLVAHLLLTADEVDLINYSVAVIPPVRGKSPQSQPFRQIALGMYELDLETGLFKEDPKKGIIKFAQVKGTGEDTYKDEFFAIRASHVVQIIGVNREGDLWRNPSVPWSQLDPQPPMPNGDKFVHNLEPAGNLSHQE